ncbi:unnamed protein product [Vitrella brassicaformis CCMP3155]|uniref:Uncharacterized protein n=1 Tax=Vitrella brassicaformis (strain CCMP3155) TaxID=1169540 RepID=A0A0G4GMF6_VITBC|nr:unnamed protein product [Vitrella brassicaformis CCMP3155]|eukprot:CEM31379.1 unnamed protein product [Vitrella brassicaformis CCMP3155]
MPWLLTARGTQLVVDGHAFPFYAVVVEGDEERKYPVAVHQAGEKQKGSVEVIHQHQQRVATCSLSSGVAYTNVLFVALVNDASIGGDFKSARGPEANARAFERCRGSSGHTYTEVGTARLKAILEYPYGLENAFCQCWAQPMVHQPKNYSKDMRSVFVKGASDPSRARPCSSPPTTERSRRILAAESRLRRSKR